MKTKKICIALGIFFINIVLILMGLLFFNNSNVASASTLKSEQINTATQSTSSVTQFEHDGAYRNWYIYSGNGDYKGYGENNFANHSTTVSWWVEGTHDNPVVKFNLHHKGIPWQRGWDGSNGYCFYYLNFGSHRIEGKLAVNYSGDNDWRDESKSISFPSEYLTRYSSASLSITIRDGVYQPIPCSYFNLEYRYWNLRVAMPSFSSNNEGFNHSSSYYESGKYYYNNSDLKFTWAENNTTHAVNTTLDGSSYRSGTVIGSGEHTLIFKNCVTSKTYNIVVDYTAPVITMKKSGSKTTFYDGDTVNEYPIFTVTDSNLKSVIIKNNNTGATYDWGTFATSTVYYDRRESGTSIKYKTSQSELKAYLFEKEMSQLVDYKSSYTAEESDHIFNEAEGIIAKEGTPYYKYYYTSSGKSGDYKVFFTKSVLDNFINSNTNNYVATIANQIFNKEGSFTITATDKAGNVTSRKFIVDATAPTGTLNGVTNGGITGSDVYFTWTESGATATLDGQPYTKNTPISKSGSYKLILKDNAGNIATYTFTIDKDAPEGTLNGVSDGGATNGFVSFTWKEGEATATLDGQPYEKGSTISDEGLHVIVLSDVLGNQRTYTFEIDRTPPEGELVGVENGGATNMNVHFIWAESSATATLDKQPYILGSPITSEGRHSVQLTDVAGNTATYTFEIDRTPPEGTLVGVENFGITNNTVTFTWKEVGATATLDDEPYTKGSNIIAEGSHTIVLSDNVGVDGGNKATYFFIIDKSAPVGELVGVINGGVTNGDVIFGWAEDGATATLNGETYLSGTVISIEENTQQAFTLILQDQVNNQRKYTFTIDKVAPVGKLNGVADGGKTKNDVTFTWTEEGCTATLNLLTYSPNDVIKAEGTYTMILRDVAGNTATYTFEIDKTAPVGEFTVSGNLVSGIYYFNKDITFICSEDDAYAEIALNKTTTAYSLGSTISAEGSYTLTLYDTVLNSVEYKFVIDKTPYTVNMEELQKNHSANISKWYQTYNYNFNQTQHTYVQGQMYSFTNQADALRYAYNRERSTIDEGIYRGGSIVCTYNNTVITQYDISNITAYKNQPYYIYKSNTNASELKVYFNISNLENALNKYANNSVTVNYIPNKTPTPFPGDANVSPQPVLRDTIYISSTSFTLPYPATDVYLYINGNLADYNSTLNAGINYIDEIDYAGNAVSYSIILDIESPYINCTNLQGTYLEGYEQQLNSPEIDTFYFDTGVILTLADNYDSTCVLKITFNKSETFYIGENCYLTEPGTYKFEVYDIAGNHKTGTIYISTDAPEFTVVENLDEQARLKNFNLLIDKKDSFITLGNVSITLIEEGTGTSIDITSDFNGEVISPYTYNYLFVRNGEYTFQMSDNFGRTVTLTYTFISEAPVGTLCYENGTAMGDKRITNRTVYFTWSDTTCLAYYSINGSLEVEYRNYLKLSEDGDYTIYLRAPNGKESVYTFTIDTISPTGKLFYILADGIENELSNRGKTNGFVRFTYDKEAEPGATVMYSTNGGETWSLYEADNYFTLDGDYTVQLTDAAGNSKNYTFTIDTIPPEVQIRTDINTLLSNNMVTNHSVKFVWTEGNCTATINNEIYKSGTLIYDEGKYVFHLVDEYNNFITLYVTIDKTAPVGELSGVTSGGITNTDVTFTWTEEGATATLDGQPYTKGSTVSAEGSHTIVLSDVAGNATTYTFEIDRTPPEGELSGVTNGSITNNNVTFTWVESGAYATLNGDLYTKRNLITAEGVYTLVLCDAANNESIYTFEIDKTAPVGELVGVENGGITNSSVYFTWTEVGATATLNNIPYIAETNLTYIGAYKIILKDIAGNIATYTFTIDTLAPVGELNGVENGGITNNTVYFTWNDNSATATLDGQPYAKRDFITSEGKHSIVLTSKAGNTATYTFEIDKTAPEGTLNGVTNGSITNDNVYFTWTEEGATATLNGQPYYTDSVISLENVYTLILRDVAGNTATYTFEIDKTAPVGELVGVTNGGVTSNNVYFTWTEVGATATLDGQPYTKRNYISSEGKHVILLTDVAGNATTYAFEIDRTPPEGELVGVENGGITNTDVTFTWTEENCTATLNGKEYLLGTPISDAGDYLIELSDAANNKAYYTFSIDQSLPEGKLIGVENGGITSADVYFVWSDENCTVLLNDYPYAKGTVITESGNYLILLLNRFDVATEYTFTIDKDAPYGTLNGVENGGATNTDVTFTWTEEGATATLDDEPYESGSLITSEGKHTVQLIDNVGNMTTYTFTIDKTAPVGELVGVENGDYTNTEVLFTWVDEDATATLNTIAYASGQSIVDDADYTIILTDLAGNYSTYTFTISHSLLNGMLINVEENGSTNLDVSFLWSLEAATATLDGNEYISDTTITEEGEHTIILVYGKMSRAYTFTIDKTAPEGTLNGVTNGGVTNTDVTFTWAEEGATATLDGEAYRAKSKITTEGLHVIVLSDVLGNQRTYTFEIDRTPPEGELNGGENGGITNTDVTFTWTEKGATATLDDEPYESGSLITSEGKYTVQLTDVAGNTATYTFEIDKTAPTFEGIEDGAKVNTSVVITFEVYCTAAVEYFAAGEETPQSKNYTSTIRLSENGIYTVKIMDAAHNVTTFSFEIFYHKPDVAIEFEDEEKNVTDIYDNRTYTFTESFTIAGDYTITINDEEYVPGTTLSDIGTYKVKCADKYGNLLEFNVVLIEESTANVPTSNPMIANVILIVLLVVAIFVVVLRIVLGKMKKKRDFRK